MEVWQADSVAIRRVLQVYGMLEGDLKQYEECLDSSGQLCNEKDRLVNELYNLRKVHEKKLRDLNMLKTATWGG